MKLLCFHMAPLLLLALALTACHNDPPVIMPSSQQNNKLKDNMINANRTIAQAEETSISEYVQRRNWQMQRLANGARVWEYQKGSGKRIDYEDSVHLVYDIETITGKTIYKELQDDYVAGRRQTILGLDEAVMQLHGGSRAKIILPSNLAYGIGGDGDRIPQSAILVLDVTVK